MGTEREPKLVESIGDLLAYFAKGGKTRDAWRMGSEYELIGVRLGQGQDHAGLVYPTYEGPRGIGDVLRGFEKHGWRPVMEGPTMIGLSRGKPVANITLEPGGQFEHAVEPLKTLGELQNAVESFVGELKSASDGFGIDWLGVGFRVHGDLDSVPWMPKQRYHIMRDYLPARGELAHRMMKQTATVQVNLDYADEDDAAEKFRCMMSVTSVLSALFANSPIVNGRISDFMTYRTHIWRFTDPDRCGILPFAFADRSLFRSYTEWALDVPMFFVYRDGYIPAHEVTFRRFMAEGFRGHRATLDDWELHLSTLFPEVRLKTFFEVRGCDCGPRPMVYALAALCTGLLYGKNERVEATKLLDKLSMADRLELSQRVERQGLAAEIPDGRQLVDVARDLVAIAKQGLNAADRKYLEPLLQIAESGRTQADELRDAWRAADGDVEKVLPRLRF